MFINRPFYNNNNQLINAYYNKSEVLSYSCNCYNISLLLQYKLLQALQIASNFAANFCVFKLISSITSSLADDDYKIVIESFQHIIIVVFHSCSL